MEGRLSARCDTRPEPDPAEGGDQEEGRAADEDGGAADRAADQVGDHLPDARHDLGREGDGLEDEVRGDEEEEERDDADRPHLAAAEEEQAGDVASAARGGGAARRQGRTTTGQPGAVALVGGV